MSKKKKGSVPVAPPKQEKKMVIDMNRMNLKSLKDHRRPNQYDLNFPSDQKCQMTLKSPKTQMIPKSC